MILYCKVTHNPTNSLHFCNIAEQDNLPSLLTLQGCRANKNALPRALTSPLHPWTPHHRQSADDWLRVSLNKSSGRFEGITSHKKMLVHDDGADIR